MTDKQDELLTDMEAVRRIPIVPGMLEVICRTTGMGFAAVARVTKTRWLACSVRDEVQFGLQEGGELQIETTLCNEIRDSLEPIIFDNAAEDNQYRHHHTPRLYGLQSYISVPIVLRDGTFFGTLCAIGSKPAKVNNPTVISTFKMFAELLAFHLESLETLERTQKANLKLEDKNRLLTNANFDLDNFVYTASHDLKSPIYNIEGLLEALSEAIAKENLNRKEIEQITAYMKSSLHRLSATINDLTTIAEIDKSSAHEVSEPLDICEMVDTVKQDLHGIIASSGATITTDCTDDANILGFTRKNLKSILYNLLSNAIKYQQPGRQPVVLVKMRKDGNNTILSIADNGSGIPTDKLYNVFTMFKRFHDHVEGSGLGLYIVKRMVDNADGKITVESEQNKGTTFTIVV
ncbi:GAF domain-containing sensor histidine kinase [Pontibacter qinzhouensis]|uniref:histidine kinase n=1 Tax=Pontibacter qinzhouensis TaxID=2603253 RepID=A0A5C8II19_9BACT|nr:GAF domain-containing sensor histidine kinase [Pontibacter qinzhouensis]TXK20967.1 GAF domain-containing sensor histidine kinase [Pontibacter qinzhouensis]